MPLYWGKEGVSKDAPFFYDYVFNKSNAALGAKEDERFYILLIRYALASISCLNPFEGMFLNNSPMQGIPSIVLILPETKA
jgi:hypothetical protein